MVPRVSRADAHSHSLPHIAHARTRKDWSSWYGNYMSKRTPAATLLHVGCPARSCMLDALLLSATPAFLRRPLLLARSRSLAHKRLVLALDRVVPAVLCKVSAPKSTYVRVRKQRERKRRNTKGKKQNAGSVALRPAEALVHGVVLVMLVGPALKIHTMFCHRSIAGSIFTEPV